MLTILFKQFWTIALTICLLGVALGGPPQKKQMMKAPSIAGSYKLVSRRLPNGTVVKPPDVMGMQTFTREYRNFNVVWRDANGKHFSYSVVSAYKLTAKEYTETTLFTIMNDEIGGKEIAYSMTGETKSAPVKMEDGKIEMKLPFDPPSVVFEGNTMTATTEGMFTDYWEKVK